MASEPRPHYDHARHAWVPQCPYGDICTGCDAAGECARAWWYDENGKVIVTADDRFHGEEAKRCRELVESLVSWDDLPLWQYRLDLLREAIEHEQATVDRERRNVQRDADNEGLAEDFEAGAFYGGCNPEPSQGAHGNG